MKYDLSAKHQDKLIGDTLARIRECREQSQQLEESHIARTEAIKQRSQAQQQEVARNVTRQKDGLESEHQQIMVTAKEALETDVKLTKDELQQEVFAAKKLVKQQLSDGEYDWFLSKQRLVKEVEADKEATREAYKLAKAKLKQQGASFTDLIDSSKAALGKHGCELKVHGGDLLDPPDDANHLAAHQQSFGQIQQLIVQFRKTFWVRFQEERWYLIAFLLGMIALPFPLHMAFNSWLIAGIASAVAGVVTAIVLWAISRRNAGLAAHQFQSTFVNAIATGKQQLLASQHQNKSRRDKKLRNLEEHGTTQTTKLDKDWDAKQIELKQFLAGRLNDLQTLATKRGNMLHEQFVAKEQALAQQFNPGIAKLKSDFDIKRTTLSQTEKKELAAVDAEIEAKREAMEQQYRDGMAATIDEVTASQQVLNESRVDLTKPFDNWTPPKQPASAIPLGQINFDLKEVSGPLPKGEAFQLKQTDLLLPVALDLLNAPSLLIETANAKKRAAELLRLSMVRLLTSIPPGKLRFTIVDSVGLGESFSSFMHLADYDEEMIQHRIWTEPQHIQTRLADLTHHMENIIQTYLRNEFATIQEYNVHAGEVAEAFRVLVIANFPSGFNEEAAQRLQSIISSGPRCGVFTLLSFDPTQSMPRNFDVDEMRRNANVLILDNENSHWANDTLRQFPIECDTLPKEEQVTHIMHCVGKHAKEASRVEVPFSAVAPVDNEWWTGDSRNEISVSLGRAGATKLQEIRLGRGTSQHVLISGKTGSGKSTLLHAMITNLSLKYSPDEVQFYLIDFKKGVEFKAYAEHGLPHARVIAIESEREFGQSVLQRLDAELRRRGDLFRRVGVQSVAGYRDARPDEKMPRMLLVIDEFQEFFVKEDKISQEASLLLDRLVRQGRAFGIHVLLGSQTLAGAYSLARATIGQMAVRIALQCSAADANLILSDDNDAARLLRRPGEAIYNDANGMVEGNHPFQVVWLTDLEKETYLRSLAQRNATVENPLEPAIVFEGNVAADAGKNLQLQNAWTSPAPEEVPLAPRAWLGEAVAIKEAPAVVFHRRSGANMMIVGQQDETAMGIMASSLLSLASYSPSDSTKRSRLVILDGTRPESPTAGYWQTLCETTDIAASIIKPRDALDALTELAKEVQHRQDERIDNGIATFFFIYNLSRFRDLQKSEDDFGFGGGFGEEKTASPAEMLASVLKDGPNYGIHTILWSESYTNLMRWIDRPNLRDIESRVLFQMSATDSSNLMDSSAASQLGPHRAMFYSEDRGRAERFRPYGLPDDDFLLRIRGWQSDRGKSSSRQSS